MRIFIIISCLFYIMIVSCKDIFTEDPGHEVRNRDGRILIVDQTGKEWDVTHAMNQYGMQPERFQFGLGPNAIRPIQNPQFLDPGDPGYPDAGNTMLIIGSTFNGVNRAYPINVLTSHEIVDDVFGEAHVAVAY